jgi:hypothetical protein
MRDPAGSRSRQRFMQQHLDAAPVIPGVALKCNRGSLSTLPCIACPMNCMTEMNGIMIVALESSLSLSIIVKATLILTLVLMATRLARVIRCDRCHIYRSQPQNR